MIKDITAEQIIIPRIVPSLHILHLRVSSSLSQNPLGALLFRDSQEAVKKIKKHKLKIIENTFSQKIIGNTCTKKKLNFINS